MCGIVAFLGIANVDIDNISGIHKLYEGLCILQNRGYDSAGISSIVDSNFLIHKYASREKQSAFQLLSQNLKEHQTSTNIIGHCRFSCSVNRALWLTEKLHTGKKECRCKKCIKKKCKCSRCSKKCSERELEKCHKRNLPSTTASDLLNMVMAIYQTSVLAQRGTITFEQALEQILSLSEPFEQYIVKGTRSIFLFSMEDNLLNLVFIKRYNLPSSDCVVAFNLLGIQDLETDGVNDVVMGVSEARVDEDMSDAVYNPNIGLFMYLNEDTEIIPSSRKERIYLN
jgi:hypothetical protein